MKKDPTLNNSLTDWKKIDEMTDESIDLSDCPEITPEMFTKATIRRGSKLLPLHSKKNSPTKEEEK
ncbi:hypothetical protein [Aphanothece hegewaldii]|uniref:hypothetical protein n=1 Tax=Aphanothece hegewaldii TaxID=1521625 RepID=UPI0011B20016|nr:hypothetical protein [Aphanothece hegewaldii]